MDSGNQKMEIEDFASMLLQFNFYSFLEYSILWAISQQIFISQARLFIVFAGTSMDYLNVLTVSQDEYCWFSVPMFWFSPS